MNNIIGYKAPFDLFRGTETPIKKGYVLVKHPKFEHVYVYSPFYEVGEGYGVCKEIVETWEAVYERKTVLIKDLPLRENRKIIGYKLLKDLPKLPKDTISKYNGSLIAFYFNHNSTEKFFDFTKSFIEENPDWFEPVYEKTQEEIFRDLISFYAMLRLVKIDRTEETIIDSMIKKYEIKEKE